MKARNDSSQELSDFLESKDGIYNPEDLADLLADLEEKGIDSIEGLVEEGYVYMWDAWIMKNGLVYCRLGKGVERSIEDAHKSAVTIAGKYCFYHSDLFPGGKKPQDIEAFLTERSDEGPRAPWEMYYDIDAIRRYSVYVMVYVIPVTPAG